MNKVYDALEKACDMSLYWNSPEFHCFRMFEPDIRALPAMYAVESQLSNGGVIQLIGNARAHWAELFEDSIYGYRLIGSAEAAKELEALQQECLRLEKRHPWFSKLKDASDADAPAAIGVLSKMLRWDPEFPFDEI